MSIITNTRPFEILMVEDNAGDIRLITEVFKDSELPHHLNIVRNGVAAIDYLHRRGEYAAAPRPDIILLDLNLPRKDGREVLDEIKSDSRLQLIPTIVLTSSEAQQDIQRSYALHANCYIIKPIDLDELIKKVQYIAAFWLTVIKLPHDEWGQ